MAYAALVSLEQTIDQILNHDEYTTSPHQKQQIISLDKYAILFQAFLEDSPEKANNFEGRIRDVATEAEDIIEHFMAEQIRTRHRFIKCIAELAKIKFEYQLKKITDKMDSIAAEVVEIKNSIIIKDEKQLSDSPAASSSSRLAPTAKIDMVGFDDDLMTIKAWLCGGESSKLQVLPIVGMGGIGKTALTRNAYDDPLIMEYFHVRAWITVSQDYSTQEILSGLLVSMKVPNEESSGQSNESVDVKVYKCLKGRRYLIVMDDVWSTKAWDDLRMIFPDDHNGSRIILTTRLSDVAAYPDSSIPLYEMRFMDEDQSWNLLQKKVFSHKDCPSELEDIGKMITRSCGGLPLAIVVIAGLLSTVSQTPASWGEIAENINSVVATKDGQLEKILSLSYTRLPHYLRSCFLYMGGFPEDYEIHVSKIIKLWIAEDFVKSSSVFERFEERAEEYLEDLVKRSLILVTKRKSNGKIKSCSLHDMVRDLCIRISQEEKFLLHVMGKRARKVLLKSIKNQRRISIAHSDLNSLANIFSSTIRTIMYFQDTLGSFGTFRLLRVLDVVKVTFRSHLLPDQFFELFHLRYLAFCYYNKIPAAISNLQNLQTLIIRSTYLHLSSEIWRMPQLRHLVFSSSHLPHPKGATFALENLHTLSEVKNLTCYRSILEMIPNLKKLGLTYYGDGNYLFHNLVHLRQLEKLKLTIRDSMTYHRDFNPVVPSSLKKLTLIGWKIHWYNPKIVGPLPNLEVLKLRNFSCQNGKWRTIEGDFPQLKFLLIDESNLEHWITESSHFPRLKCLLLYHCRYLSEIPDGIAEIPTLELIEVKRCKKSLVDSAKWIQEEQQSYGNDDFQVIIRACNR